MGLSLLTISYLGHPHVVFIVMLLVFSSRIMIAQSFHTPFSPYSQEHRKQEILVPSRRLQQHSIVSKMAHSVRYYTPISSHVRGIVSERNANDSTTLFATSIRSAQLSSSDQEDEKMIKEEIETSSQNKQSLEIEEIDNIQLSSSSVSKFRQLKDVMWIRETLEDWTAAEFALSVEQQSEGTVNSNEGDTTSSSPVLSNIPRKSKNRAVDYEKLLSQLTKRVEDMICQTLVESELAMNDQGLAQLDENVGMGRYAYSNEERTMLLGRILKTRANLFRVLQSNDIVIDDSQQEREESYSSFVNLPKLPSPHLTPEDTGAEGGASASIGPKLYVRDDGTVDWEGALQDRAALSKFGGAVWARINGQTPVELEEGSNNNFDDETTSKEGGPVGSHESKPAVTAKIEDTLAIQEARERLMRLEGELDDMEKAHTALVASGISAGQPVANVRLALLDPVLRNKIRQSAETLLIMEQKVSYQNLVYELERIYTYLATELGNPTTKGYIPLQDRLNVAEYGLLESQIENCSIELNSKGVLDADILAVIAEQMTDFKRRLGIDYYVTGLTFDREDIGRWLNDLYINSKSGVMFYVKGIRLFWNDILYGASLIGRAVQGCTLKPREVRFIRRTFKDVFTFIPVLIILILPLTPVGHVLIFGAIQRFSPGFFPSCFTEQRQNLLQLYETTEFSEVTIKENLQERLTRFLEALVFSIVNKTRDAYKLVTKNYSEESSNSSTKQNKQEKTDF
mmetsp:Transcript_25812/g.28905  ORF Transcript_25812/g.28905 Transcript_25812/m.28905 type:complete len:740 (-) Transcript_25812:999-3218(-)